jgi:hypothetical protein
MAVSSDESTATCTFDTSELKAAPFNLKWSSDINYQVVGRNSEGQVFSPTGTNPVIVERCSQEINLTNVSNLAKCGSNVQYCFRVQAKNIYGYSEWSDEACFDQNT